MAYKHFMVPSEVMVRVSDMSNGEFREAMADLDASLDTMAKELGVARRLVAAYRKNKPLPRAVAMATRLLLSLLVQEA